MSSVSGCLDLGYLFRLLCLSIMLGLFLACHAVLPVVGCVAYAVLVSGVVWACIMATLNPRNVFLSGIWAGCRLCFAVFAAGVVSGCGAEWLWVMAWWGCRGCFATAWQRECGRDAFGGPCAGLGVDLVG